MSDSEVIKFEGRFPAKLLKWKVKRGINLSAGTAIFIYEDYGEQKRFKSNCYGIVQKLLVQEGEFIVPGQSLLQYESCAHTTVMKDMCAECGLDLRKSGEGNSASVSMIHSVPELKVSLEQAKKLGKADEEKLLERRKLVLLVDLDQTLIHTTNEKVNQERDDIFKFQLYGSNSPTYHTKLRPFTTDFLKEISKYYELHICTFGARMYAHKIAQILDPEGKLFSHRILSRDECFDPQLKTGNLSALFPCGDSMVCIIDDREDVWNYSKNLIAVRPYSFFANTGDINSPNRARDAMIAKASKTLNNKSKPDTSKASTSQSAKAVEPEPTEQEQVEPDQSESSTQKVQSSELNSTMESNNAECKPKVSNEMQNKTDKEVADDEVNEAKKKEVTILESESKESVNTVDSDDYLLYLQDILKRIHTRFYNEYDEIAKYAVEGEQVTVPDLKMIIPNLRKEILKSVNIVFSGVIPTNITPEKSKMWEIAKALGANVSKDIIFEGSPLERTTHLVAASLGTVKVQKAIRCKKIRIVNPVWLYTCADRWERVDERLFPLNKDDDYGNIQKRKNKLTVDQEMFMNADLIRFSCSSKMRNSPTLNFKQDKTQQTADFPTYDPITGKQIRKQCTVAEGNRPSTSGINASNSSKTKREEVLSADSVVPHNMLEFNPLAAFSSNDLLQMDKEVEDACSESDHLSSSSSESERNSDENGSEAMSTACQSTSESIKKRKRTAELESSSDDSGDGFGVQRNKNQSKINKQAKMDEDEDAFWESQMNLSDDNDETRDSNMDQEDEDDDFNDSIGSYDEEMGRALERDFLS